MSPLDGDLLRLLSHMPLLDRMEMAALSGWSGGGVYRAVGRLEDAGLIASVPHGTELIPRPAGSTSPPPGCAGWPTRRTRPPNQVRGKLWRACSETCPSRPAGGASSWNDSTPWPSSTASPPPYPTRPIPSASSGIAPCRWTPP